MISKRVKSYDGSGTAARISSAARLVVSRVEDAGRDEQQQGHWAGSATEESRDPTTEQSVRGLSTRRSDSGNDECNVSHSPP